MQRRRPAAVRILSAVAGLAFGLLGAELTFGQLRPEEPRSEAVLYSIEVRNDAGDLLYSPMLVGEEGRPVHLNLVGPHSAEALMSLDLDPRADGDDNLCLGYRLAIERGVPGEDYLLADDQPVTLGEFTSLVAREMNAPPPIPVPEEDLIPQLGAWAVEAYTTCPRVDSTKARRDLEWAPRYRTIHEGVPAVVRAYKHALATPAAPEPPIPVA